MLRESVGEGIAVVKQRQWMLGFHIRVHHVDNLPNMLHPNPYNGPLLRYEEPAVLAGSLTDYNFPFAMLDA